MFSKIDNAIRQTNKHKIMVSMFGLWFSFVVFVSIINAISDGLEIYNPKLFFLLLFGFPLSLLLIFYSFSLMNKKTKILAFSLCFLVFLIYFLFHLLSQKKEEAPPVVLNDNRYDQYADLIEKPKKDADDNLFNNKKDIKRHEEILKKYYEGIALENDKEKELQALNEKISKPYLDKCYGDCGSKDACKIQCDIIYKYTDASSIIEQ